MSILERVSLGIDSALKTLTEPTIELMSIPWIKLKEDFKFMTNEGKISAIGMSIAEALNSKQTSIDRVIELDIDPKVKKNENLFIPGSTLKLRFDRETGVLHGRVSKPTSSLVKQEAATLCKFTIIMKDGKFEYDNNSLQFFNELAVAK